MFRFTTTLEVADIDVNKKGAKKIYIKRDNKAQVNSKGKSRNKNRSKRGKSKKLTFKIKHEVNKEGSQRETKEVCGKGRYSGNERS